jgi:hypothetical protein
MSVFPSLSVVNDYELKKKKKKRKKKNNSKKGNKRQAHFIFEACLPFLFQTSNNPREEEEPTSKRRKMSCSLNSKATSVEPMCRCGRPTPLKTSFTEDNFSRLFCGCVNFEVRIIFNRSVNFLRDFRA